MLFHYKPIGYHLSDESAIRRYLRLLDEYRPQRYDVVILSSWRYFCPHCQNELPPEYDIVECPRCNESILLEELVDTELEEIKTGLRNACGQIKKLSNLNIDSLEALEENPCGSIHYDEILDRIKESKVTIVILFVDRENRHCESEMVGSIERDGTQSKFLFCHPSDIIPDSFLKGILSKSSIRIVKYDSIDELIKRIVTNIFDMIDDNE